MHTFDFDSEYAAYRFYKAITHYYEHDISILGNVITYNGTDQSIIHHIAAFWNMFIEGMRCQEKINLDTEE